MAGFDHSSFWDLFSLCLCMEASELFWDRSVKRRNDCETFNRNFLLEKMRTGISYRRFSQQFPCLTRDFIGYSLYDRKHGYFNKKGVINSPPELSFQLFVGSGAYRKHVALLYKEMPGGWLTPVELFQPHYSIAIANWILRTRAALGLNPKDPLNIVEFGGGSGTCALNILNFLQWTHPDLYHTTTYTVIEISATLKECQVSTSVFFSFAFFCQKSFCFFQDTRVGTVHKRHFRSVNMSATQWSTPISGPVFVIALEVSVFGSLFFFHF